MISAELCAMAISAWTAQAADWYEPRIPSMTEVCVEIADSAYEHGADVYLMIAIGWKESRFRDGLVSSAGAHGPMQVMPHYHCPDRRLDGCDLIDAGVHAYLRFLDRYGSEGDALCAYNGGTDCGSRSREYARDVSGLADDLVEIHAQTGPHCACAGQDCATICGC
jgi:soluble lytic murein transglycosylase-like protein